MTPYLTYLHSYYFGPFDWLHEPLRSKVADALEAKKPMTYGDYSLTYVELDPRIYEVFERGVKGILLQKGFSQTPNSDGETFCEYLSPDGSKCFIGHSIKAYNNRLEAQCASSLEVLGALELSDLRRVDRQFLDHMQEKLHDNIKGEFNEAEYLKLAQEFAETHHLKVDVNLLKGPTS